MSDARLPEPIAYRFNAFVVNESPYTDVVYMPESKPAPVIKLKQKQPIPDEVA